MMDLIIFPAVQDRIGIFKARLVNRLNGTFAGFRDNIKGKAILLHPFFNKIHLIRYQVAVADAKGFDHCIISLIMYGRKLLCLFRSVDL